MRNIYLILCFAVISTSLYAADKKLKGNGKIVKKTISINDYNEISIAGSMDIEYMQKSGEPFLEITIDENIFPLVEVEQKNKQLIIGFKRETRNNSYNSIQPTVYKIKTNSKELAKLNAAGSGTFTIKDKITMQKMEINMAGSGEVLLNGQVSCDNLELNVAGSGEIIGKKLNISTNLSCNLTSSGTIHIAGKAPYASYNISGSGRINGYDCRVDKVSANIVGSGDILVYANNELSASVMGSGDIYYKGNPKKFSSSTKGSGSIIQAH